jgi:hypothetical protein
MYEMMSLKKDVVKDKFLPCHFKIPGKSLNTFDHFQECASERSYCLAMQSEGMIEDLVRNLVNHNFTIENFSYYLQFNWIVSTIYYSEFQGFRS